MLTLLLTAALGASGFHPASRPEAGLNRWMVLVDSKVKAPLPLLAHALTGREPLHVWPSVHGFLVSLSFAEAQVLSEASGVRGVFQDMTVENGWSAPLPDCSQGGVMGLPVPSTSGPQSISCDDPDPQNPNGVCPDNWGLDRIDGTRDGLFSPPRPGTGVRIFVIDTGVYSGHQEFQGRIGQGYDATGLNGGAEDCGAWSHGTHVAAIAAGRRFGVAKGATVHPVRVAGCPLTLAISSIVSAFDWIAQVHTTTLTGPAVATMSINAQLPEFRDPTQVVGLAISAALNAGVVVVESAGNQAGLACDWSTNVPGAIIVGGSDELDTPWERRPGDPNYSGWCPPDCGSNGGSCVSLFAPAAHIVSAWFGLSPQPSNTCRLSGTSMAAPAVAGAAALFLQANPTATPAMVKAALIARATPSLTQLPAQTPNLLLNVVEGTMSATVAPMSLDFGTVDLGTQSMSQRITVTSTGSLAFRAQRSLTGAHPSDFVITTDTCAGASVTTTCFVEVAFLATTGATRTATLSLSSNGPTVALSGVGRLPRLSIRKEGTGEGRVLSDPGLDCGATCSASYFTGSVITLEAVPAPGSTFDGWVGCSGTRTCTLSISGQQLVVATFNLETLADAGLSGEDASVDAGPVSVDASVVDAGPRDAGQQLVPAKPVFVGDAGMNSTEPKPCGCVGAPGLGWALAVLALMGRRLAQAPSVRD